MGRSGGGRGVLSCAGDMTPPAQNAEESELARLAAAGGRPRRKPEAGGGSTELVSVEGGCITTPAPGYGTPADVGWHGALARYLRRLVQCRMIAAWRMLGDTHARGQGRRIVSQSLAEAHCETDPGWG